jgi:hypothetical protein
LDTTFELSGVLPDEDFASEFRYHFGLGHFHFEDLIYEVVDVFFLLVVDLLLFGEGFYFLENFRGVFVVKTWLGRDLDSVEEGGLAG